tara:strand:- start:1604 stop:1825 length:222 start_codon:yes stop_codon:yes gene_type:complete
MPSAGQVFNNPDGFAMAFSDAWDSFEQQQPGHDLDRETKFERVMQALAEHPFLQEEPQQAEQLARFRMRLLNY